MDLKRYRHTDAQDVRSMLLDIHDDVYADNPDPYHRRERWTYFLDRWSSRENWRCILGWEDGGPVGFAYGAVLKPGGGGRAAPSPRACEDRCLRSLNSWCCPAGRGPGGPSRFTTR